MVISTGIKGPVTYKNFRPEINTHISLWSNSNRDSCAEPKVLFSPSVSQIVHECDWPKLLPVCCCAVAIRTLRNRHCLIIVWVLRLTRSSRWTASISWFWIDTSCILYSKVTKRVSTTWGQCRRCSLENDLTNFRCPLEGFHNKLVKCAANAIVIVRTFVFCSCGK
jgi:hypothetical protein